MHRWSVLLIAAALPTSSAFSSGSDLSAKMTARRSIATRALTQAPRGNTQLGMVDDTKKAAPVVTGEELEMMLQEWEEPLVVDAYATW